MVAFILSRHFQDVKRVIVSHQNFPVFKYLPRYLQGYIALLSTHVPLVPSELIFNLDETGLSDWEEKRRNEY
jgi:hypothetical protein